MKRRKEKRREGKRKGGKAAARVADRVHLTPDTRLHFHTYHQLPAYQYGHYQMENHRPSGLRDPPPPVQTSPEHGPGWVREHVK